MVDPRADLATARSLATFESESMTHLLYGVGQTDRRRRLVKILEDDPELQSIRDQEPFLSKADRVRLGLKKTVHFWDVLERSGAIRDGLLHGIALDYAIPPMDNVATALTDSLFSFTLKSQMTPEQQRRWLPLVHNRQILGCYAQTEMGHGSNVRGVETTATFDVDSGDFILHSPTLTSTKWWPGNMGLLSTHAAVFARLVVGGTDHGVHPLLVQLRDMKTHLPLRGITLGTSGPTMGYYANEHGRCRFDHVRVPRDQLMMKWVQVSPSGVYTSTKSASTSRPQYWAMMATRVSFVRLAAQQLGRGLTVSVRYNAIRRQGFPAPGVPEPCVIDYQMQQYQLFPLLAGAYALHFTAKDIAAQLQDVEKGVMQGGQSTMDGTAMHAAASAMKVVATAMMADGIEVARRCCGGYGYALSSGLPQIHLNSVRMVSTEGDNTVLGLQAAKYLLKKRPNTGTTVGSDTCRVSEESQWRDPLHQSTAFAHWVDRKCGEIADRRGVLLTHMAAHEVDNALMVDMVALAKAHGHFEVWKGVTRYLEGTPATATSRVLTQLRDLFGLSVLDKEVANLLVAGYCTGVQVGWLRQEVLKLLSEIRPNAVALVDAFDFSDRVDLFQSCLGARDGDVYRRLWEFSERDPLNQSDLPPGFDEFWRPFRDSRL